MTGSPSPAPVPRTASAPRTARSPRFNNARKEDRYTRHIATPTELDFGAAAALYGLAHERVSGLADFRAALERAFGREGSSLIEVPGERAANLDLHERLWHACAQALNPRAAEAGPRT